MSNYIFKIMFVLLLICFNINNAHGDYYTLKPVELKKKAIDNSRTVYDLDQNQTVYFLGKKGEWTKVETISGHTGYIRNENISNVTVKILKKERKLSVYQGEKKVKEYTIALCEFNPLGDKEIEGDGGTPEGRFFICESIKNPGQEKYGARSMRLSYPSIEDARRGLEKKYINYKTYAEIVLDIKNGRMPTQKTKLGSSLRIHGGGSSEDWTLGCVALEDRDIIELWDIVPEKFRVDIYKSAKHEKDKLNYTNVILKAIKKQIKAKAVYSDYASGYIAMDYPLGDIKQGHAVCTDVVIRALREVGIDLQALLHEDIITHPSRYSKIVSETDYHIDHRRTKNLKIFCDYHMKRSPLDYKNILVDFKPGNIVIFDTDIPNGTDYDHIGIVSNMLTEKNIPLVFNIWTTGCVTELMDLLNKEYPVLNGHYEIILDEFK